MRHGFGATGQTAKAGDAGEGSYTDKLSKGVESPRSAGFAEKCGSIHRSSGKRRPDHGIAKGVAKRLLGAAAQTALQVKGSPNLKKRSLCSYATRFSSDLDDLSGDRGKPPNLSQLSSFGRRTQPSAIESVAIRGRRVSRLADAERTGGPLSRAAASRDA